MLSPYPDINDRESLAQSLLSLGIEPIDLELKPDLTQLPLEALLTADLRIPFPAGLAPVPQEISPAPATDQPLPKADVVVVTWTVDELRALCDVLTPGFVREKWYRYNRNFDQYLPRIRPGAPARAAQRLGSYFLTQIDSRSVLCIKSELHLNQDRISTGQGTATLPVKDFWKQIIAEVEPKLVMTIGTSGSVWQDFALGHVVVTRGAKFRCRRMFLNEPYNNQAFRSDWSIPTTHFATAEELMQGFATDLAEPPVGPPTLRFNPNQMANTPANEPKIHRDGEDPMPEFHPILTTDYFEYGTSTNHLDKEGAAVEMGDAVLGLVCSELQNPPNWVVVRNMSDPLINGDLPAREFHLNEQTMWAVAYYESYGYYTSVMGALAAWAVIAGLT